MATWPSNFAALLADCGLGGSSGKTSPAFCPRTADGTLAAIIGELAELGYGFAWRVLDAQFLGVPQRRRRVFVVGHLGDWRRAAAVLLEREGLCRDTPPRRKAREAAPGDPACGAEVGPSGGRFTDLAPTLDARCKDSAIRNQIGLLVFGGNNTTGPIDVATACNAHGGSGRMDFDTETVPVDARDASYDASKDVQGVTFVANRSIRFSGGDNDTKYHISLPLGALTDKNSQTVPAVDCRKMYMVFAPRFEIVEEALDDGCFLTAGVGPGDTIWSVDSGARTDGRAVLHRRRRERGARAARGWRRDQHPRSAWVRVLDAWLLAGGHPDEEAPADLRLPVRRGVGRDHLEHRGHRRCEPQGGRRFGADRGVRHAVQVHRLLGGLQVRRGWLALAVVEQGARAAHRPERSRGRARGHDPVLCHGGARSLPRHVPEHGLRQGRESPWTAWRPPNRPSISTSTSTAAPRRT